MAHLKLQTGTQNQILRTISKPVKKIDKALVKFIEDMKETMDKENGIGLAAPQVGQNIRVIVAKFNHGTKQEINIGMINPEIISSSAEMEIDEEGCLSVPKKFDKVARSKSVVMKYLDVKGKEVMLKLTGLPARIIQHEIDHIDGILFVDKIVEEAEILFAQKKDSLLI